MHRHLRQLLVSAVALLRGFVARWLDVGSEHWACCSQFDSRAATLTNEFFAAAEILHLELHTSWPVPWLLPRLALKVLDARGQPITVKGVCVQSWQNGALSLVLTFPAAAVAGHAMFFLWVISADNRRMLSGVAFHRLDRDQLLSELKVRRLEAYACLGSRRVVTQEPHSGLQDLGARVELQLSDREHRALFKQIPAEVTMALAGPQERAAWKTRLEFDSDRFRWDVTLTAALPLLRRHPGRYQLTVSLGKETLANLLLNVRSEQEAYAEVVKEVESQATLEHWRCQAVDHRGQCVQVEVVAEDVRELCVEALIIAPQHSGLFDKLSLPLACVFRSRDGETVICREVLDVALHPGPNPVKLKLALKPHLFREAKPDCVLELRLGNRLLADIPVTHKTRREIIEEKIARLLESLSIKDIEMAVERESEWLVTETVFATDRQIKPRFIARAEGFDADVQSLTWQLTIQIRQLATGRVSEQTHTLRIRAGTNRCHRLAVAMERLRACLPPGRCMLSLYCLDRLLAQREFRFVPEDEILTYTQQSVLASLRVVNQQLICESRGQAYITAAVPFCADRIRARFTLQSEGFNATLPELNLPLHLTLSGDGLDSSPVCETAVTLSSRPATLDLPFSLQDAGLADQRRNYRCELHSADREIGRINFRIVSEAEIIQYIEVASFEMTTVRRRGGTPLRCTHLILQDHRELRIGFSVRAGFPVPGFALPGRVEVLDGKRLLFSSDFLSPLGEEAIRQELKPLPADVLWARTGERDRTLHVQVSVAGSLKCRHPLEIRAHPHLTNFEGALRQDADVLGNVDDEYEAILQELGV